MIKLFTEDVFVIAKSTEFLPLKCENCGKVFYRQKKEIAFVERNQTNKCRFCSPKCNSNYHKKRRIIKCENCGKTKEISQREYEKSTTKHFFCNKSCAASYNNQQRAKHNTKFIEKRKNVPKERRTTKKHKFKTRVCKLCGYEYVYDKSLFPTHTRICCCKSCSKKYREQINKSIEYREKLSIAGRHSMEIQSETRRSKNEKLFCELCEKTFANVEHNTPMFNGWDADVILKDEKIAVLWNGNWHHIQISKTTSLKQIQNRDKIKISEIIKCGYTPYVINDTGKYNPQFVINEFEKLKLRL